MASGVLKPFSGHVEILGKPLDYYSRRELARTVSVLPQDTSVRFPFKCGDIVRMGRYPYKRRFHLPSTRDREAVERAMSITDTAPLVDRLITHTSGGEKQRVLIARVLAQETPLIMLDEPTSAMDVKWSLRVLAIMKGLCSKGLKTVLVVMHDINTAVQFCTHLVFLKKGRVFASGTVDEVLKPEILEQVYEAPASIYRPPGFVRPQVIFSPDPDTAG